MCEKSIVFSWGNQSMDLVFIALTKWSVDFKKGLVLYINLSTTK